MRHVMALMVILVLLIAIGLYSARNLSGEVAVLYTIDAGDRIFETQLWVLEDREDLWIRAINPTSQWLDRLVQRPEIQLERDGVRKTYRATPLGHRRAHVNELIAVRYGWAEWLLTKFENRENAVPVLLDPFV